MQIAPQIYNGSKFSLFVAQNPADDSASSELRDQSLDLTLCSKVVWVMKNPKTVKK